MTDINDKTDPTITSEWLRTILRKYHRHENKIDGMENNVDELEIEVGDFDIEPGCPSAEVLLSDLLAINVNYKINGSPVKLHLMVKLLPQDPFSRFFVQEAQFDLREIQFYTQVVPDFQTILSNKNHEPILHIPKCYYARYEEGTESVLVLENLCEKGYTMPAFTNGLSLDQATSAVKALAQVHALALGHKKEYSNVSLPEKYPFLFRTERATDSYQHLIDKGFPQLANFLDGQPSCQGILAKLKDLKTKSKDFISELLSPREPMAVITHTDFWCNNLMFDKDNNCRILDWQMITYSQPTNDLALLFLTSLSAELRRASTDIFLSAYWSELNQWCGKLGIYLEEDYQYNEVKLRDDYKQSQLLALLLCIGSIDLALGHEETEQRLVELLKDLDQDGIL